MLLYGLQGRILLYARGEHKGVGVNGLFKNGGY
jgi:hypothetical protein